MWQCKKCKRKFAKTNQQHSCVIYPLKKHFAGQKSVVKPLFDDLIKKITKNIGPVKIESLPCCIHLVSSYTFGAVWAMKDRVRIDFRLDKNIKGRKFYKKFQMSKNRYLYYLDIKEKKEIDKKLISWIKKAYNLNEK